MGGVVDHRATASVITYNAEADVWYAAPPLPSQLYNCCAATVDGEIFFYGASGACAYAAGRPRGWEWREVETGGAGGARNAICGSVLLG